VLLILAGHGFTRIGPLPISVRNLWRNFRVLSAIVGLLLLFSPRARSFARAWIGDLSSFMLAAALMAFLLSLGPEIRSDGRLISEVGPYHFFYWHVPGFDGLRVPARFAMLVMLFLSVTAGLGAAMIERRVRRGGVIAVALGALAIAEAFAAPIVVNGTVAEGRYATPPARVYIGDDVPGAYRFLKSLPSPRHGGRRISSWRMGVRAAIRVLLDGALAPAFEWVQRAVPAELQHERHTPAPPSRLPGRVVGHLDAIGRDARSGARAVLPRR
jgi:hypothetical protein